MKHRGKYWIAKKSRKKIADLPNGIRTVLEEKFKADFVSIEKIDETKLI